jgi:hypothetical protein
MGQAEVIAEIGKFIATPSNEIGANTFVLSKARELGELHEAQHVSVHRAAVHRRRRRRSLTPRRAGVTFRA